MKNGKHVEKIATIEGYDPVKIERLLRARANHIIRVATNAKRLIDASEALIRALDTGVGFPDRDDDIAVRRASAALPTMAQRMLENIEGI